MHKNIFDSESANKIHREASQSLLQVAFLTVQFTEMYRLWVWLVLVYDVFYN